ncbi:choice-of-anchor J domain-containing protein [Fulvivirgaceae bacterium PWU4]|uniref:Choice-of-anchor J domain-containing protein n=1 Tax=Chryseosolibacter histidini TaxID=2782349 RepID=A0AAP2DJT8_9BACT|nr:choice-of-anchor J domain-containing protein [Chryseosolibacter histidini]MBT1697625.1 choice-of-anchor J domain-containing protein [Chryseosolibacter histidini]
MIKQYAVGLFTVIFVCCGIFQTLAQDRCGTVEMTQQLRDKNLLREDDNRFESWIGERRRSRASGRVQSGPYRIPVVVHIIHKGEAVGTGVNISDEQVRSQIKVLNRDFNRLNTDASSTPSEFAGVAAKLDIEFVLAKQNPAGEPTTGIVRVRGSKNTWTVNDDATLKAQSYWPAEDYLNLWVTDLSSGLLGYAQFPVSSLAGLESAENNRLTDGVAIDYTVTGSLDDGNFNLTSSFNRGRTATHEVGHFFGLRHIWGDDNGLCGGNGDYVADTPDQGNSTSGCPSHPQTACSVHTMFQNYMDYTNDACMNLFTSGQADRMMTVIENSPRRASLLVSDGADDPSPVQDDLAIRSITSPVENICAGSVVPSIRVVNEGTNPVTTARIELYVNGVVKETRDVVFNNPVAVAADAPVTFSPLSLATGSNTVKVKLIKTNGASDGKTDDNEKSVTALVPENISMPFTERFVTQPAAWKLGNADGLTAWSVRTATKENASNTALYMKFFNASEALGAEDIVFTPVVDLSSATDPYLAFDVAYAGNQSAADGLKVYVITDCSNSLSGGSQVYSKSGSALATAQNSGIAFVPSGESDWRKEIVSLRDYAGLSNVQLAFVGVNARGNNLYLDNIAVTGSADADAAITAIVSPSPVRCDSAVAPVIKVKNTGEVAVTSFKITGMVDNVQQLMVIFNDLAITPGQEQEITLPGIILSPGENRFTTTLSETNGFFDKNDTDNRKEVISVLNKASDLIPLRQYFDDGSYADQWTITNPADGMRWETVGTNYGQSLYFNSDHNINIGDEAWLVSPVLDFTQTNVASVFFDLSYQNADFGSKKEGAREVFKVLASKDCGSTYEVLLSEDAGVLTGMDAAVTEVPSSEAQWRRQFVNLSSLAGEGQMRIAFVVSNGHVNDLYLDNIEFYLSDNPAPQSVDQPYSVYGTDPSGPAEFYITFNLSTRQDVAYALIDVTGKQVTSGNLSSVLNQTYTIDPKNTPQGIYVMRLRIGEQQYSTRVFLK